MKKTIFPIFCLLFAACASPAALPPETPISVPASTATPTVVPTATPSPTLTPTPYPDGPCDNPLVPLVVGSHWVYRVTTDAGEKIYNLRVLERRDAANILMLVELADEEKSVQEQVICLDGAIENFPLFVMDMLFADKLNKFMNTYHDKGVYAPAHASFSEAGWALDWQTFYLTEDFARVKNPMGPPDLIIGQFAPINIAFKMDGVREPVTVPAGEFPQALKVSHDFSVSATWGSYGGHLTIETTHWYEPYVGLVRAQADTASYSIGIQEFSIPWNSVLELIEFTPGK